MADEALHLPADTDGRGQGRHGYEINDAWDELDGRLAREAAARRAADECGPCAASEANKALLEIATLLSGHCKPNVWLHADGGGEHHVGHVQDSSLDGTLYGVDRAESSTHTRETRRLAMTTHEDPPAGLIKRTRSHKHTVL